MNSKIYIDIIEHKLKRILVFILAIVILLTIPTYADTSVGLNTTSIEKPVIASEGAILMNANTGEILYSKNADTAYYPASITKIMTGLLTVEQCSLSDNVIFSNTATSNLESGAVSLNITEGDVIGIKDCMYGLLLKSANEIANGLAEHIAGSVSSFAIMMNAKAKALGCTNTNFVNPNGLYNSNHYTTCHDMALISKAAFENSLFCSIDGTVNYTFPITKNNTTTTLLTMGNKMLNPVSSLYYDGVIGGKTGYTSKSLNTLVTCAQRDGIKLIVVVMKSSSTHYADTKKLMDYGFELYGLGSTSTDTSSQTSSLVSVPEATITSTTVATTTAISVPTLQTIVISPIDGPGADTSYTLGWNSVSDKWYYIKGDYTKASSEILTIDDYDYSFADDGTMETGWIQDDSGYWYYCRPVSGSMKKSSWILENNSWYYVGTDGKMLVNTTTPDGYKVDSNGMWIQL